PAGALPAPCPADAAGAAGLLSDVPESPAPRPPAPSPGVADGSPFADRAPVADGAAGAGDPAARVLAPSPPAAPGGRARWRDDGPLAWPSATTGPSDSSGVRVVSFTRWGLSWWLSEQLVVARVVLGVARDGQQRGGVAQVHQTHPLGLPACFAHLAGRGPDHPTGRGDRVQLVVDADDERADQRATPAVVLDGQNALAASTLNGIVLDRRALGVAARGGDEDEHAFLHDGERQQLIAAVEPHPQHAGGGPAHRAQHLVARGEPDRLALGGDEQQVVGGRAEHGADQLVVLAEVDADEAARARRIEVGELRLLDQ